MDQRTISKKVEDTMENVLGKFISLLFKLFIIGFLLGFISGKIVCDQINNVMEEATASPVASENAAIMQAD